jgi:hypothetical protein
MSTDDRRERLRQQLTPRTFALVEALVRRGDLTIREISAHLGLAVTNARTRLAREVYSVHGLNIESRAHLISEFHDLFADGVEPRNEGDPSG